MQAGSTVTRSQIAGPGVVIGLGARIVDCEIRANTSVAGGVLGPQAA